VRPTSPAGIAEPWSVRRLQQSNMTDRSCKAIEPVTTIRLYRYPDDVMAAY
jgi:hypothetical protein